MRDDKLIEALNKAKTIIDDGVSVCDMMDRKDAEQYLDAQEAIDEALAALQREQWIPVSERLPPEGVDVLVLHDYGQIVGNPAHRDYGKRYRYKITRRYGNEFLSDLMETGQATHWMPLPPAPVASAADVERVAEALWLAQTLRLLRDAPEQARLEYAELDDATKGHLRWDARAALRAMGYEVADGL